MAFREYEDGWVVANPSGATQHVSVPQGQARVMDHSNLKDHESSPLVTNFSLESRHGVILLKPGRKIGNEDNDP